MSVVRGVDHSAIDLCPVARRFIRENDGEAQSAQQDAAHKHQQSSDAQVIDGTCRRLAHGATSDLQTPRDTQMQGATF